MNEVAPPVPTTHCTHPNGTWFDRSICPEPCGFMHNRCVDCGIADSCIRETPKFKAEQHAARHKALSTVVFGHFQKHTTPAEFPAAACLVDDLERFFE